MSFSKTYTSTSPKFQHIVPAKMTLRDMGMLKLAEGLAAVSSCRPHKLGAIIFKRNQILGRGYNSTKSHPLQAKYNRFSIRLHAEIAAIVEGLREHKSELAGATIAVSRLSRRGTVGCSLPCHSCLGAIRAVGISRIVCYGVDDEPVCINMEE